MSTVWLREISTAGTSTNCGLAFASKCYAMFLRYALGFTNYSEVVSSGSYWSFETGGVNGSLNISGSDFSFRDSTASGFGSGDTGKWLLIVDPNNARNMGFYKVTYVSADTVTIDFRSGGTEYPTQVLTDDLVWYLLADNYDVPGTNSTWGMDSPYPYTINCSYTKHGVWDMYRLGLSVTNIGGVGGYNVSSVYFSAWGDDTFWFYMVADTGGDFIYFLGHNATHDRHNGAFVSKINTYETNRVASEKIGLSGPTNPDNGDPSGAAGSCERIYSGERWGGGHRWDVDLNKEIWYMWLDYTYATKDNTLVRWTSREKNARRSSVSDDREDLISNDQIICDMDGFNGNGYSIYGWQAGHYVMRENRTKRTAFNDASASPGNDKFYWASGVAFDWPSVTPQH